MGRPHVFGRSCEEAAARTLVERGWTLLARNFRSGHREIDLIARRGRTVAFVEVKGRRGLGFGHPLEAITYRKRVEIARVARAWIGAHGRPGLTYRFDAIAVLEAPDGRLEVEHVEDAWRL